MDCIFHSCSSILQYTGDAAVSSRGDEEWLRASSFVLSIANVKMIIYDVIIFSDVNFDTAADKTQQGFNLDSGH